MHKYLLIIFSLFAYTKSFSQLSMITGKVESQTRKEKLAGAFVSCTSSQGKRFNTVTDIDGEFKVKDLSPGFYELKIEYVGFITYANHLAIEQNKTTELNMVLAQDGKSLADVQVFGKISQEEDAGARQKEQRSNNVVNVISAKAMEGSPDINAANVLQRVSGVGKPQTSDLISTAVGDQDPKFKTFDGKVATPNGAANNNDFHLNSGSAALGKGNSTFNNDIGAYTSDGKGNKH